MFTVQSLVEHATNNYVIVLLAVSYVVTLFCLYEPPRNLCEYSGCVTLQAVKTDIIRSLTFRCQLLCEDLLQAEEEQGKTMSLSLYSNNLCTLSTGVRLNPQTSRNFSFLCTFECS